MLRDFPQNVLRWVGSRGGTPCVQNDQKTRMRTVQVLSAFAVSVLLFSLVRSQFVFNEPAFLIGYRGVCFLLAAAAFAVVLRGLPTVISVWLMTSGVAFSLVLTSVKAGGLDPATSQIFAFISIVLGITVGKRAALVSGVCVIALYTFLFAAAQFGLLDAAGYPPVQSLTKIYAYNVVVTAVMAIATFTFLGANEAAVRRQADRQKLSAEVAGAVTQTQKTFVQRGWHQAFLGALSAFEEVTASEYGFIGEVLTDEEGALYLKTYAITNIAWNDETHQFYRENIENGIEFKNLDTLFGAALKTGTPVIANNPYEDNRRGGLPEGHPSLNAFLGVPIYFANRLVAMVGLANRPGGYDEDLLERIEPFLECIGQLVQAKRDSIAREESENALEAEKEWLKDIIWATGAGTWEWNVQTGEVRFNERWAEIVGLKLSDLKPHIDTWLELCHPDDLAKSNELLTKHFEGITPAYDYECRMRHKNGSWIWVADRGRVVSWTEDGKPLWMSGTHMDVTKRRLSEVQREKALQEIASFFDVALEMLCIASVDGALIKVSRAFERVFGYPVEEMEGQSVFDFVHPDDLAISREEIGKLREGRSKSGFVNRCRCMDGSYRHVEWQAREANGVLYVAARDISDRLAYERELKERTAQAEAANMAKSQFLATMSHEVRTPMNGVLGMLDLILETEICDETREMAETASFSAKALMAILNDILDLSKLEANQVVLESLQVNIVELAREVVAMMAVRAGDRRNTLTLDLPDTDVPDILSDTTKIRQVLANLLSNALKFTEGGEITLSIRCEHDSVDEIRYRVEVRDTGIGIPANVVPQLFKRFVQADASMSRKFGGTGLGLAISKQIVELMGGEIGVTSEEGKGSTFWFTLVAPPAAQYVEIANEQAAS